MDQLIGLKYFVSFSDTIVKDFIIKKKKKVKRER